MTSGILLIMELSLEQSATKDSFPGMMILFQLDHLDERAESILGLERNPKKVHEMALLGEEKANRKETWEVRGREFAALIERLQ